MCIETKNSQMLRLRSCRTQYKAMVIVAGFFFIWLTFLGDVVSPCSAAEDLQLPPKKVLILPSYNINYPGSRSFLDGIFEMFNQAPFSVTYYHENLHLSVHATDISYLQQIAASLKIKYAQEKPDIIIINSKPAVQFMTQYGKEIFGDVPVVFAGHTIENFSTLQLSENYTGVTASYSAKRNIDLILQNHPDLQKLYIVAGAGALEQDMVTSTLLEGEHYKDRLEFVVLDKLPLDTLAETLSTLENNSAILYLLMQKDVNGTVIMPAEMAKKIGSTANMPAYGILNTYMGSGLIGGYLVDNTTLGRKAAQIATDILLGKKPREIPIVDEAFGTYRFDWRQLKRWGINESQLPAGSIVSFKETNIWELYKWHIIAGLSLLLFQGILIAVLLINRSIRKKTQTALEKSETQLQQSNQELNAAHEELTASYEELLANEEHLNHMYAEVLTANEKLEDSYRTIKEIFNAANDIIIVVDSDSGAILEINQQATELFGYSEEEFKELGLVAISTARHLEEALHRIRQAIREGPQLYERETMNRFGFPLILETSATGAIIHGKACCLCVLRDISQRKLMEKRLEFLSLHDSLTGLYNRSYFEEITHTLQTRGHTNIGLFVCDVDGLKLINDTLGHRYGDDLLKAVAALLNRSVTAPNFAARIGGDEFAIVLPNASRPQLEALDREYRQAISSYNNANPQLPLSLSIGWAISETELDIDSLMKEADNNMYRQKIHQQQSIRSSIVQTMMKALEVRDHITEGHAERLGSLMEQMAKKLQFSPANTADLRLFAQFHDIGKVGIPDSILNKPGKLTEEEMIIMRRHCEIGFRIARASPDLAPIADLILKHQEHWDGSGYPLGITGEDIPIECRILAIIDAYDAMTSDRPYRKAMSSQQAITEIRRCAGTQFDTRLAELFIDMLTSETPLY